MITRGHNNRQGGHHSEHRASSPGSFDIVHLRDKRGQVYATRLQNVFVIGEATKPWISLPKGKGIKLSVLEERDQGKTTKERE